MLSREETLRRLKAVRHSSAADRICERSLTMSEIARATGIPRPYLHEIASGKSPIGVKTHPLLSDFFECQENERGKAETRQSFATSGGTVFTFKFPV